MPYVIYQKHLGIQKVIILLQVKNVHEKTFILLNNVDEIMYVLDNTLILKYTNIKYTIEPMRTINTLNN